MSDLLFQTQANRLKPSGHYLATAEQILSDLVYSTAGIDGVLLASTDGFEISSVFRKDYDAGKLSAVGSSILSLVQALTSSAQLTGCHSIILNAENGKIMLSLVPSENQPMILIIVTKQKVSLGQVVLSMGQASSQLTDLDQQLHSY